MQQFLPPEWKGRKVVRRSIAAALTIGALSLSASHVYAKTEQGWTRQTVISRKSADCHSEKLFLTVTVFLTSGTTWTVPADFGALVSVECVGGGGGGNKGTSTTVAAGGGGSYAKIVSTTSTLTPGVTVVNIGVAALASGASTTTGNPGGDTWWNATSAANALTLTSAVACAAKGAAAASSATGGIGGSTANSTGTTKFAGGNGSGGTTANGGGGAAGPNGPGSNGSSTQGGAADGGTVIGPTTSTGGNSGTEWDSSHGCGTGGLTLVATAGKPGGFYGGGGIGCTSVNGGNGAPGLLVITYAPIGALIGLRQRQFLRR